MTEKLDIALDDLVAKDPSLRRGRGRGRGGSDRGGSSRGGQGFRGGRGGGAMRGGQGYAQGNRAAPYQTTARAPATHYNSSYAAPPGPVGNGFAAPRQGNTATKLLIANLHPRVDDADLRELFGTLGPLVRVAVQYSARGQSLGTAEVVFAYPERAFQAYREYNGLTLDGRPMKLNLVDDERAMPRQPVMSRVAAPVRDTRPPQQYSRGGGQYNNRDGGRPDRGGRGAGRGGRGGRGGSQGGRSVPKTQEDLDKELESFMGPAASEGDN
eukprot:comp23454_c0_seq1/m.39158 comp23454_c0_seq1/g.39158  ORF comp23454_c0_seq1/g.39158 comp23454_c0_seq1/m.39158 type:complete len:269 (-) comp23454_c0_seq1:195-1001(-)